MSTIAKVTEIIAESSESFEHAIKTAVDRANDTLDQVKAAWVKDQQAVIEDGRVVGFRVTLKITFVLKDKKK